MFGHIIVIIIGGSHFALKRMLPGIFKVALIAGSIAVAVIVALIVVAIILAVKSGKDDAKKKGTDTKTKAALDADQTAVLTKGREQLMELRRLVMRVKNRSVHDKAYEICGVADKILQTLKQKPEKIQSTRQFLNYYLPTLGEIISKYRRIEESGVPHDETTQKVESYLTDIKKAMDKQYANLFADDMLDMSVEMEAMKMAVKRDGLLTEEEMKVDDKITLTL